MKKKEVQVVIKQNIAYHLTDEVDRFEWRTPAILIELSQWSKLIYENESGETLELKWPASVGQPAWMTLTHPHYQMHFDPRQVTHLSYPSPQGYLDLQLRSSVLQMESHRSSKELTLSYQLVNQGQILGDYEFQLQLEE